MSVDSKSNATEAFSSIEERRNSLAGQPTGEKAVVDVDVDKLGELETNDDYNDPSGRAGSDAVIETEKLLAKLWADMGIETTTHLQSAVLTRISKRHHISRESRTETEKHLHASYHRRYGIYHRSYYKDYNYCANLQACNADGAGKKLLR